MMLGRKWLLRQLWLQLLCMLQLLLPRHWRGLRLLARLKLLRLLCLLRQAGQRQALPLQLLVLKRLL